MCVPQGGTWPPSPSPWRRQIKGYFSFRSIIYERKIVKLFFASKQKNFLIDPKLERRFSFIDVKLLLLIIVVLYFLN